MFPEYLRDVLGSAGDPDQIAFRDRGPQLTRGSRAMKLWLSMQVFGLDAFRAGIDRCIDLAERAEALVRDTAGFEVVTPARLAILTFHAVDTDNDALAQRVVEDGYTAPSTTVLRGRTVLRMCTINPRTTDDELERSIARIADLAS
jgi:glutamate/tyrosine decarboxylase-like PLP-dependent enzyme